MLLIVNPPLSTETGPLLAAGVVSVKPDNVAVAPHAVTEQRRVVNNVNKIFLIIIGVCLLYACIAFVARSDKKKGRNRRSHVQKSGHDASGHRKGGDEHEIRLTSPRQNVVNGSGEAEKSRRNRNERRARRVHARR